MAPNTIHLVIVFILLSQYQGWAILNTVEESYKLVFTQLNYLSLFRDKVDIGINIYNYQLRQPSPQM